LTAWLLDTNILSELRRKRPEQKVLEFVAAQPVGNLYVSSVSFAEIRFGIALVTDISQRSDLDAWLAHKLRPLFAGRVLAISEDIMFKWRLLIEEGRKTGHTYGQPDLIIAATALHHDMTVVSRDVGEFLKARARVFNPWTDSMPERGS
jgi:predicted nucleic acid-binding protein